MVVLCECVSACASFFFPGGSEWLGGVSWDSWKACYIDGLGKGFIEILQMNFRNYATTRK